MQRFSAFPMIVLSALVAVLTVVLTTGSARAQTSSPLVQWGDSSNGQTNNAPPASERFIAISAGQSHSLALRADGSLVQWGATNLGQANNAPPASERFIAIAEGDNHNLALRADGSLVQWGRTNEGQANNAPPASERFIAIAAGPFHNLTLRADGSLVQWGDSSRGQANNAPPATERFIAISAGQSHSLALRADGSLVQWGATNLGQANNAPPASERFIAIAASTGHNLALKSVLPANVSFTYQGRLTGQSGPVDLQCVLYNASTGGDQVGATTTVNSLSVDPQGLFTAVVTPGAIDASGSLWLEVRVAPAGSGSFATLASRQPITRAPVSSFADVAATAQFAVNAQSVWWSGIKGAPANVTGAFSPWEQGSRGIYFNVAGPTGNVGIGAFSPASIKLQVNANTNDGLYVHTANESPWALRIGNDVATAAGFQTGMYVTNSGFFRITNRIASANGTYAQLGTSGAWTALSDARLKTDVTTAEGNLAAAMKLRPVNFRWKGDGAEDFGLIAQEVRAVLPRLVTGDESKDSLTLNYSQLSVVAIGAIQEQQREIERMKAEAARHAAENADLKARLERLEKALETKHTDK
jgi:hypothetical protein